MKRFAVLMLMASALIVVASAAYAGVGAVLQTWETITPNSGGSYVQRNHAGCIESGGKFIVIGGTLPDGTISQAVDIFDPATNAWAPYTTMPTKRKDFAVVKAYYAPTGTTRKRDFFYVIGGYDEAGNALSSVDVYDLGDSGATPPVSPGWTTATDMPSPRGACVAVNNSNSSIMVYGGYPNGDYIVYTLSTNSWATSNHVPPADIVDACGVFAADQGGGYTHGYLLGGTSGNPAGLGGNGEAEANSYYVNTSLWDRSAGEWTPIDPMPEARRLATAFTVNTNGPDGSSHGIPLVFGGTKADGTAAISIMGYMSTPYSGWYMGTKVAQDLPVALTDKPCVLQVAVSGTQYIYVLDNTSSNGVFYRAKINASNYPGLTITANRLIGAWENVNADCPNSHETPAYGVVNDKLYIIGGRNSTGTVIGFNDCYDPATNTWSSKAPMPFPMWRAACAVVGSKIYIMGGGTLSNVNWTTHLQIYDTATDTWVDDVNNSALAAPLPQGLQQFTAVAVTDPATGAVKIHTLGSRDSVTTSKGLNVHYIYDVATNTWTKGPNLDQPRNELMACVVRTKDLQGSVLNQWVYFGGGATDNTQLGQFWRFDPMAVTPNWYTMPSSTRIPQLGNTSGRFVTVTDSNGAEHCVQVGGQYGPAGSYNQVYTYHTPEEPLGLAYNWTYEGNMPNSRSAFFGAGQIGNYLYVAGGSVNGDLTKKGVWRAPILLQGPPPVAHSIADLYKQLNGVAIPLDTPVVVTRVYHAEYSDTSFFWVEDTNRAAGIRVVPSTPVSVNPGDMVTFTATLGADPNTREKIAMVSGVTVLSSNNEIPKALVVNNRGFVGASVKDRVGRAGAVGLNNVGMLVKITGRVTVPELVPGNYNDDFQPFFYLDDGTGLLDGTTSGDPAVANVGIRVYMSDFFTSDPGDTTHYVTLRGIVGLDKDRITGKVVPALYSDDYIRHSEIDFKSVVIGK